MFCQRNPVAVRLLLTWVARLKDKELFRLGVRIEHVWLAALASVPSQNQGAAVSGSAAFVEAPHHFLRVTAECTTPLPASGLLTLSRAALLLLKKPRNSKKSPGCAFQFARRRRSMVAPGKTPAVRHLSAVQRAVRWAGCFPLLCDACGVPWMGRREM